MPTECFSQLGRQQRVWGIKKKRPAGCSSENGTCKHDEKRSAHRVEKSRGNYYGTKYLYQKFRFSVFERCSAMTHNSFAVFFFFYWQNVVRTTLKHLHFFIMSSSYQKNPPQTEHFEPMFCKVWSPFSLSTVILSTIAYLRLFIGLRWALWTCLRCCDICGSFWENSNLFFPFWEYLSTKGSYAGKHTYVLRLLCSE
jgi:hypothetical protein